MAKTKYDLDINKQSIIKPVVILRQGDYGIDTMQVSLAVANEPMDLTGATIKFMGTTANGSKIIDNEHVKIIDAHGGVFEYVFPSEAASDIGEYKVAYFSIVQANGQSSTMDFRVQVLSGVDLSASAASDYVSHYDTMVSTLNSAYNSATSATNTKMAAAVSSVATSASTVLNSALARVATVNSQANNASSTANNAVSMASSVASVVTSQATYINSVASSAAADVDRALDKLNNISVGGRNYILNSSGLNTSASSMPVLSGGTADSFSQINLQTDRIVMTNNQGSKEFFYGLTRAWTDITKTPLIAGTTYTLSVKARGTSPQIALRLGYQNPNTSEVIGFTQLDSIKWTKASYTFTIPAGVNNMFLRINGGINNRTSGFAGNETIEFKEVMLEQSNVASDWTPAPEDADKTFLKKTNQLPAEARDFNYLASHMQTYQGIWWNGADPVLNAPTDNWTWSVIEVVAGNAEQTGIIRTMRFGIGDVYSANVNGGVLRGWKLIANDANVVHNTGNETVAGDKTFTGTLIANNPIKAKLSIDMLPQKDLNSATATGQYKIDVTYSNAPSQMPNGAFIDVLNFDDNLIYQVIVARDVSDPSHKSTMWVRIRLGGNWGNWQSISKDDNVVHKTGNETVAGDKTLTGNTTLASTTILAGNYGLRVTSSGFQKTTDGKTWVSANI